MTNTVTFKPLSGTAIGNVPEEELTFLFKNVDKNKYFIHNSNTDSSYEGGYGTENNLIEFVKSANDTFTYIEGDTLPLGVELDNGEELAFTFVIDALTSECVTITFTAK